MFISEATKAERRKKEEAERKAKLDEIAERQRQREKELEEKERLREESLLGRSLDMPLRQVEHANGARPSEPVADAASAAAPTSGKYVPKFLVKGQKALVWLLHQNRTAGVDQTTVCLNPVTGGAVMTVNHLFLALAVDQDPHGLHPGGLGESIQGIEGRGPACVEELYKCASSKDKTLTIYPGMWHQLVGELEENVEQVFNDILHWLRSRAEQAATAAPKNLEPPNANGTPTQQEAAA